MKKQALFVDPDISVAETLPASFYSDNIAFESLKEKVFAKSWQLIGHSDLVPLDRSVHPFQLLDGYLSESLLLSRSGKEIHCLSNVCTHRGNLVVHYPGKVRELMCEYHGRRFHLDGKFKSMPEFKETKNFPRPCDNLTRLKLESWGPFLFTGFEPEFPFSSIADVLNERVGFLSLDQFKYDANSSKDYLVNCHWALYCDNYLEGFHIPFVHPGLTAALDLNNYTTIPYEQCVLQIGYADTGEELFDLPEWHPDFGKEVAAYYYWIFPNLMLNFYPWGLSINIVKPISSEKTRVSFITYIYDESKQSDAYDIDKVEREDEYVVEGVNRGLKSRFYQSGRFSPTQEKGVHHFHLLLSQFLAKD